MARKPVHIEAADGQPTARQRAWAAMRRLRQWTLPALADAAQADRATVRTYLLSLVKGGYAVVVGKAEPAAGILRPTPTACLPVYELARDVGVEAPRVRRDGSPCTAGIAREQMWRTMRMLRDWSPRDLAIAASTEAHPVSDVDAGDYAKHLAKAGYLAVTQTPRPGSKGRHIRYRLIRNTGPHAPAVARTKLVWDPNLGRVTWHEEIDQ